MIIISFFMALLSFLLRLFWAVTGNYGIALILLSVTVSLITMPFVYLAERLQRKIKEKQRLMASGLQKLREVENGRKRYFYVRRLYKIYHYHPAHSMVGLSGLLIQLPFFIAAYMLIRHYPELHGKSFFFISDLSRPDAVIKLPDFSINILPFIMVAVNLAAFYRRRHDHTLPEQFQGILIPILFFFLLYDQPAALLIYWTMNNIVSLLRGLIVHPNSVVSTDSEFKDFIYNHQEILMFIVASLFCYLITALIFSMISLTAAISFIAVITALYMLLFNFIDWFFWIFLSENKKRYYYSLLAAGMALTAMIFFDNTGFIFMVNAVINNLPLLLAIYCFIVLFIFNIFVNGLRRNTMIDNVERSYSGVISLAVLLIAMLLYFYLPASIFYSAPADFTVNIQNILLNNITSGSMFIIFTAIVVWSFRRYPYACWAIGVITTAVVIFFCFNSLLFCRHFGLMSAFEFDHKVTATTLRNGFEVMLLIAATAAAVFLVKQHYGKTLIILIFLNLVFAGSFIYELAAVRQSQSTATYSDDDRQLQLKYKDILTFSRRGKNIVFIILDMFPGSFIAPIFKRYPQLRTSYSGFTWYPNILSITNFTEYSVPVLNGGWDFSPEALNKKPGNLKSKTVASYDKLLSAMVKNSYHITCITPNEECSDIQPILHKYHLTGVNSSFFVARKDRLEINSSLQKIYHKLLTNIALLMLTPSIYNRYIYQDGYWQAIKYNNLTANLAAKATLDALATDCSISDKSQNTFKRIHNILSHHPYDLDMNGHFIPKGTGGSFENRAFSTMKVTLELLAQWLEWLKTNGIYDNTAIIMVSDHSDQRHTIRLPEAHGKKFTVPLMVRNRLHPLLMFKPFNARAPFKVDRRFMSNADANTILAYLLPHPQDLSVVPNPLSAQPCHRTLPAYWCRHMKSSGSIIHYQKYLVSDSVFIPANWHKIK